LLSWDEDTNRYDIARVLMQCASVSKNLDLLQAVLAHNGEPKLFLEGSALREILSSYNDGNPFLAVLSMPEKVRDMGGSLVCSTAQGGVLGQKIAELNNVERVIDLWSGGEGFSRVEGSLSGGDAASGQGAADSTSKADEVFGKLAVEVYDKTNTTSDYSEFSSLSLLITNGYEKDIRGIQGILHINDMFGESILNVRCDITEEAIPCGKAQRLTGKGIKISRYDDKEMKVYETAFENLIFFYSPSKILFTDGTSIPS
jgi:hypothetical protein